MCEVEAISHQKEEIFNAPDAPWSRDLWQRPTNPGLDGISKQQSNPCNGREDLSLSYRQSYRTPIQQ